MRFDGNSGSIPRTSGTRVQKKVNNDEKAKKPRSRFQFGMRSLIGAIVLLGVLFARLSGRTTTTQRGYYENGSRAYEIYERGSLRVGWVGECTSYFGCEITNLERHGRYTHWYQNGQKWREGTFYYGQPHGQWTEWHTNGQLRATGSFRNGQKHGPWTFWDRDGNRISEREYVNGTLLRMTSRSIVKL